MPVVNITGAQGTQTWNLTADEYHVTGNATINAGATITVTPGATPNPIRFDGSFGLSGSGSFDCQGSVSTHIRIQPNGAATAWAASTLYYVQQTGGGGTLTVTYTDFYQGLLSTQGAAGSASTVSFVRVVRGYAGFYNMELSPSAGTHTWTDIGLFGNNSEGIRVQPTGGTNTLRRVYAVGCLTGVVIAATGGTMTVSDIKCVRCAAGYNQAGSVAFSPSNIAVIECATPVVNITPANGSTITRLMLRGTVKAPQLIWAPGGGSTVTLDEGYIGGGPEGAATTSVYNNGAGTFAMTNSVLGDPYQGLANNTATVNLTLSGNDIVSSSAPTLNQEVFGGTTNNDYIACQHGAWVGPVPLQNSLMPWYDWGDANMAFNVDMDSGNLTSTSTPPQYRNLTANRTLPRATPNKPLTISAISSGAPGQYTATITFTTGIKAESRIILSTTSGFLPTAATMFGPWKYDGILNPDVHDFTLPVTAHSHDLVNLEPDRTYYYRIEAKDPCGRRFLSSEQSFATQAASSGGGAGRFIIGAGVHGR